MSDCCARNSPESAIQTCCQCSTNCKKVETRTLYHQVRFPENQGIIPGDYYFCPNKACIVAYFSTSRSTVLKQDLTTYQDIQNDKLCYCFDIYAKDYLTELKTQQAKTIKNFVILRTKSGECACETRNPSGLCCLANFKRLENNTD
jgi:Zinc binding domain